MLGAAGLHRMAPQRQADTCHPSFNPGPMLPPDSPTISLVEARLRLEEGIMVLTCEAMRRVEGRQQG